MRQRNNYAAIDNFRLIAALLIVAIHTAPLASFSETADFLVTYCLGRVGVPFFLMVSGFFVLAPYQRKRGEEIITPALGKFLKKTVFLYLISTLLYLPLKFYADNVSGSVGGWLKEIFFDGTFYHLWYLPAVILGCLLIVGLLQFCHPLAVSVIVFVLYVLGVLGDSYYNLISQVPFLKTAYEAVFAVSSYTRNGIFFAPFFLWLAISLAGMLAEGFASYFLQWQKHNSMYFLLMPVMFFLFEFLLSLECRQIAIARDLSMYLYILHPLCIVVVRGAAEVLKMKKLLVEQSLVHYLAVVVATALLSLIVIAVTHIFQRFWRWNDV